MTHLYAAAAVHGCLQQGAAAGAVGGVGVGASRQQLRHNGLRVAAAAAAAISFSVLRCLSSCCNANANRGCLQR